MFSKENGSPDEAAPRATSERQSRAREIPVVLVVRGDCRHRLSMSFGPRQKREQPAKAGKRGLDTEARRSGRSTMLSFDEAAKEADLGALPEESTTRASAAGTRPSPWPNTPAGGSAARKALDQELTGPSGAGSKGNRGASRARPKLGARRQARLYPRSRRYQAHPWGR